MHANFIICSKQDNRIPQTYLLMFGNTGSFGYSGVIAAASHYGYGGINKYPWRNEKAGFSVSGTINFKDWGLNRNSGLKAGGVLMSDEVKISVKIQFVKKA